MSLDAEQAKSELHRRRDQEQGRYYQPNGRIEQFLLEIGRRFPVGTNRTWKCILRSGNRGGKSTLAQVLAGYLSRHFPNPYLDTVPVLRHFRRPNRGRIMTTATGASGVYNDGLAKWLPRGSYKTWARGRPFSSLYRFDSGGEFDIMTFDQDPMQAESVTLNWAIVDEPMSYRHWTALSTRFAFGGMIFLVLTEDEHSECDWYADVLETPERLADDVLAFEMDGHANCREHGIRGVIPHESFEDIWRDLDESQMETRRFGKTRARGGAIYKTYIDDAGGHVMPTLQGYYAECWAKGLYTLYHTVDPHDRKPWAMEWRAFFPDGKGISVAEWPDESMKPFHQIKSWGWGYNQYADLVVRTEKALGSGRPAHATVFDPNYGPKATMNAEGVTSHAAGFAKAYSALSKRGRRMIFPSDEISSGHMAVKTVLGEPARGVTPGYYWMEHCRNGRWAMTHYGYGENKNEKKGLSEVPVLQYKDFADLPRYCAQAKARYIEEGEMSQQPEQKFQEPRRHFNGRMGV